MLNLFTIPAATTTIAQMSEYTVPWFNEFLPIVYVSLGVFVAMGILIFIIDLFLDSINKLFHKKDDNE